MGGPQSIRRYRYSARDGNRRKSCDRCGHKTSQEVHITIHIERENAEYSREPYSVLTCMAGEDESITRMNDARTTIFVESSVP